VLLLLLLLLVLAGDRMPLCQTCLEEMISEQQW
jgi:hypothetical protein